MYNIKEILYAFFGRYGCFMRNASKRMLAIVFAALMLGLLGCRGRSTIGPVSTEAPTDAPVLTEAPSPVPTEEPTALPTDTPEPTAEPTPAPTVTAQVLVDGEGIRIALDELVFDAVSGPGLCLTVENGSVKDIELSLNALIVNGFMLTDLFYASIYAGTVEKETVYLESAQLKLAGIDEIRLVELSFHAAELDTHVTVLDSERVTLRTSAYDGESPEALPEGELLFEDSGIRVTGVGLSEAGMLGPSYVVMIENMSDLNVTLTCENVSVNGVQIKPVFYYDVFSNCRAMGEITFLSADLKRCGIEEIENLTLTIRVWRTGTFETVFLSDELTITASDQ